VILVERDTSGVRVLVRLSVQLVTCYTVPPPPTLPILLPRLLVLLVPLLTLVTPRLSSSTPPPRVALPVPITLPPVLPPTEYSVP